MKPFERVLILFLIGHLLSGAAGGVVVATGILVLDIANLATLMAESDQGVIAVLMLYASQIVTFGSAAMGIGVMTMGEDD